MWTALWKLKVLTLFLWKLLNDSLPIRREFAKRNVIPNASCPLYASKEDSLDYFIYWKAQTSIWAAALLSDMYRTWEMRGRDSICVLDFFFFFFLGWKMMDTVGTWPVLPQKKKTVTHFLSHQSPPTSFHTDLLCRQSSSHSNLFFFFFFFFSSIYFSFLVCPFALILVLFLFTIFFFFPASHNHTCRTLFYFQSPTWTKDV